MFPLISSQQPRVCMRNSSRVSKDSVRRQKCSSWSRNTREPVMSRSHCCLGLSTERDHQKTSELHLPVNCFSFIWTVLIFQFITCNKIRVFFKHLICKHTRERSNACCMRTNIYHKIKNAWSEKCFPDSSLAANAGANSAVEINSKAFFCRTV